MKLKLNAAIIGKNEQQSLPKCLKSLEGFDEIYYTDTGSTDRSVSLAKHAGAHVSFREWDDDFSAARNFNLDQIPKDEWVFIIDCDEYLPEGELEKIKKGIQKSKTGRLFANVFNENTGGHHAHLRLFKNNIRYKDAWHTHIPVKHFELTTINIMHKPSINHKKDPERNFRIVEKIKEKTPRIKFMLARELMGHKRFEEALKLFQEYLDEAPMTQQTSEALVFAGQCLFQLQRDSEAQDAVLMALKFNPEFKEALIAMASFSEPWKMKAWVKYAKMASNYGTLNIDAQQDERIEQLEAISELAIKGKPIKNIIKKRSKNNNFMKGNHG